MTSTPRNIEPIKPKGGEEESREPKVTRPTSEKVTPSQQGRFLGALEKKPPKKEAKKPEGKAEEPEGEEGAAEGSGVFHLAATRRVKGEGAQGEALTKEETEKGPEEIGEKGPIPPKKKEEAATTPTLSAQIAAAEAQAPAPSAVQPARGKAYIAPSRKPEALPEQAAEVAKEHYAELPERVAKGLYKERPVTPSAEEEPGRPLEKGKGVGVEKAEGMPVQKPMMAPSFVAEAGKGEEAPKTPRASIAELIRQTAEAITTFVTKNEIQTVVTIKYPPIFEGATLTVTEYSSAPRQFNVTFANLSPDARRMLEVIANQQQIKQALIDRGYTVQNIFIEAGPRPVTRPAAIERAGEERGPRRTAEGKETEGEAPGEETGRAL